MRYLLLAASLVVLFVPGHGLFHDGQVSRADIALLALVIAYFLVSWLADKISGSS